MADPHDFTRFTNAIPVDHDCSRDEACPYPPGFYLMILWVGPDEDDFDLKVYVHKMSPEAYITAMIQTVDMAFQDNRGEQSPMITFTTGREVIRQAAEQVPPPGEVTFDMSSLIDQITKHMNGTTDE